MADFDAIRRGLAANLANLQDFQVSVYLLDNPSPPTIQVAGVKTVDYDIVFQSDGYQATGDQIAVIVEAALLRTVDISAQKQLDTLHSADGLKAAVEADPQLTSRLLDDGTVSTGQAAACDSLRVARYTGSAPFTLRSGTEVTLATWEIELLT